MQCFEFPLIAGTSLRGERLSLEKYAKRLHWRNWFYGDKRRWVKQITHAINYGASYNYTIQAIESENIMACAQGQLRDIERRLNASIKRTISNPKP